MSSEEVKPPRKRLIICCDGTWCVADRNTTSQYSNVPKFSDMVRRETSGTNQIPQVVYYQSGVGTTTYSPLDKLIQGGFGIGLEDNVLTAYHYLSNNYLHENDEYASDEIFLFGFSRGAFTARALAGLVTQLGLMKPGYSTEFSRVYRLYRKVGNLAAERNLSGMKFIEKLHEVQSQLPKEDYEFLCQIHHDANEGGENSKMHHKVKVKAIGTWDTVGALGIPDCFLSKIFPGINSGFKFHDAALNSRIENAFQALALDEHRGAFKPTLWYIDDSFFDAGEQRPNLKQCWFPGFHESIGSQEVDEMFPTARNLRSRSIEVHDITLAWMCDQVDGLLEFDSGVAHRVLQSKNRPIPDSEHDAKDDGRGNWATGHQLDTILQGGTIFWGLAGGSHTRTPGTYANTQWSARITNETIHPSVRHRMETYRGHLFRYDPPALGGDYTWPLPPLPHHLFHHRWHWEESVDGRGAKWVRPGNSLKKAFQLLLPSPVEGLMNELAKDYPLIKNLIETPEVHVPEWVIREVPGRNNFEAALLPDQLKRRFEMRNAALIHEAEVLGPVSPGGVVVEAVRGQYWTRTAWATRADGVNVMGTPSSIWARWLGGDVI